MDTTADKQETTQAEHTPGEWIADGFTVYGPLDKKSRHANGRIIVATCGWTDGNKTLRAEYEANARLIAAAPDLLAALYDIYELMSDTGYYGLFKPQLDAARAAIAKAEGR